MDRGALWPAREPGKALDKTWDTSVFSLKMLGKMIAGRGLAQESLRADHDRRLRRAVGAKRLDSVPAVPVALISISLGVLNLLPIPLLDGGHLMYYMFEFVKGSPISDRAIEIGQQVGMALLFTLMVFALYNDINRLLNG